MSPFCAPVCEQPAEIIELCVASVRTRVRSGTKMGSVPFLYDLCASGEAIELCAAETKKCFFLYSLRATGSSRSIESLCGRKPQCVATEELTITNTVLPLGVRTRVLRGHIPLSLAVWQTAKERLYNTLTLRFSPSR